MKHMLYCYWPATSDPHQIVDVEADFEAAKKRALELLEEGYALVEVHEKDDMLAEFGPDDIDDEDQQHYFIKDFPTYREMVERAVADKDPASCFVSGHDWEHASGIVIFVKGKEAAFRARNLLANAGLLNPENKI